jgi:hypothetical protein
MSQAAQARASWADTPIRRRPRREPDSWASPEELEVLGGLGEDPGADWTVLTLERDEARAADGRPARPRAGAHTATMAASARHGSGAPATPRAFVAGEPGDQRRTVVIRGQAAPMRMDRGAERRRPAPRARDRIGHRPDRVAMWAVMLGVLLIVVATMTAG